METLVPQTVPQQIFKELCSSTPSVWQVAIVGVAICDGQISEHEVAIRVCFYTGGRMQ